MSDEDIRKEDDEAEAVAVEVVDGDEPEDREAAASDEAPDAPDAEAAPEADGEDAADADADADADAADEADEAAEAAEASADEDLEVAADTGDAEGVDDDDVFDPTEYLESQVEALRAELAAMQKELETAQKAASEGQDQALRAKADFANFKKRKEQELERLQEEKVEKVLLRVLPVYDTFGRAIDQYEKDNSEDALYDGLQRIEKMFMQLLESQGITPIEAQGKPFDPNIHDAVCRVAIPEDGFEDMVVDVFETGYIYGEKVLKPAKVSVAKD